jgi:hypothetical protein
LAPDTRVSGYFLAGAVAFAAAQAVLFLVAGQATDASIDDAGWFLNSTAGITTMALVLSIVAAAAGRVLPSRGVWQGWAGLTAGASLALVVAVFVLGPGTIFPIVIGAGIAVIGVAALVGSLVARLALLRR